MTDEDRQKNSRAEKYKYYGEDKHKTVTFENWPKLWNVVNNLIGKNSSISM